MAGAPLGNNNAAKAKVWSAAIDRALDKRTRKEGKDALDELAEKLLLLCDKGELGALKELGDRKEGKPAQSVSIGNEEGETFKTESTVSLRPQETREEYLKRMEL